MGRVGRVPPAQRPQGPAAPCRHAAGLHEPPLAPRPQRLCARGLAAAFLRDTVSPVSSRVPRAMPRIKKRRNAGTRPLLALCALAVTRDLTVAQERRRAGMVPDDRPQVGSGAVPSAALLPRRVDVPARLETSETLRPRSLCPPQGARPHAALYADLGARWRLHVPPAPSLRGRACYRQLRMAQEGAQRGAGPKW